MHIDVHVRSEASLTGGGGERMGVGGFGGDGGGEGGVGSSSV